jgi:hypothetical protein
MSCAQSSQKLSVQFGVSAAPHLAHFNIDMAGDFQNKNCGIQNQKLYRTASQN